MVDTMADLLGERDSRQLLYNLFLIVFY